MNTQPNFNRTLILWIFFAVSITMLYALRPIGVQPSVLKFSDFMQAVKEDKVVKDSVTFEGSTITAKVIEEGKEKEIQSNGDPSDLYKKIMYDHGITPEYIPAPERSAAAGIFSSLFPILLFGIFIWFILRNMKNANSKMMTFGKSKPSLMGGNETKVKFDDVSGMDEAKEELTEIVDFLKNPSRYTDLGGRIPKGALLIGPPGTGKTMLAKATANEAGVPFHAVSGSEFIEMFVGVGASRVRDLFETARKTAPCIIFIDEIDAVAKQRSQGGQYGSNSEADQTINQFLTEMDGIDERNKQIIVLAATNRPDILDQALLRPGRFDRRINIPLPDIKGREAILKIHARDKKIDPSVNFHLLARGTSGMSGADLANLLNEAALLAARRKEGVITTNIIEDAKDKITMGTERRSVVVKDSDKVRTAYHEVGHAFVAKKLAHETVHKISIVPRGMALGVTHMVPDDNQVSYTKDKALNIISVLMGGRAAEEVFFSEQTTGASDDIKKATNIARRMVTEWGMGKYGPMNLSHPASGFETNFLSSDTMRNIDEEIGQILKEAYEKTKSMLLENKEIIKEVVDLLMRKETISGEEMNEILALKS